MHDVCYPGFVPFKGLKTVHVLPIREGTGNLSIDEIMWRLDMGYLRGPANRDVEHWPDAVREDLACVNGPILSIDMLKMHFSRRDFRQVARLRKKIPSLLLADGQNLVGFETSNDHARSTMRVELGSKLAQGIQFVAKK